MQTQKFNYDEQGQKDLHNGLCPHCQGEIEGTFFIDENSREGGLAYCSFCELQFAWIENPFECEVMPENPDRGWLPPILDTRKASHAGYKFGNIHYGGEAKKGVSPPTGGTPESPTRA